MPYRIPDGVVLLRRIGMRTVLAEELRQYDLPSGFSLAVLGNYNISQEKYTSLGTVSYGSPSR